MRGRRSLAIEKALLFFRKSGRIRVLVAVSSLAIIGAVLYAAIVFTGISSYVIVQTSVGAIFLGGFYALVAAGLTVNFGIARTLNIAHGELMVLGAYVTYFLALYFRVEPLLTIPLAVLTVALIGIPIQKFLVSRPLRNPGGREGMFLSFLILVSLSLILQNSMTLAWSANDRAALSIFTGNSFDFYGIIIPTLRLFVLVIGVVSILSIDLFMYRTRTGMKIRATVEEKTAARLVGVDVDRMYLYAFVIASAAAGLAGSMLSVTTSFNPYTGLMYVTQAFAILVLAGLGSVKGTIVTGLIIAFLECFIAIFLGELFRYIIVFVVLLVTLIVKPAGIFGELEH